MFLIPAPETFWPAYFEGLLLRVFSIHENGAGKMMSSQIKLLVLISKYQNRKIEKNIGVERGKLAKAIDVQIR